MEVKIAVIADYALVDKLNKLSVLGIFDKVWGVAEPVGHHGIHLVCQLEFENVEAGEKTLHIVLEDADGRVVNMIEGIVGVKAAEDGAPSVSNLIFRFGTIVFPRFGRYQFKIQIGDYSEICIPVVVSKRSLESI